ncbi:KR domain-containing protein, partial [Streptomyces zhihengii]
TLTRHHPLKAFVLFSSAAGTLGNPGQANYAAANTYLDALAARLRAEGTPATAMAWGLWEEASGMTGELSSTDLQRGRRTGITAMSTRLSLALFDAALASQDAALVTALMDLPELRRQAASGEVPPLLRSLVRAPRKAARSAAASEQSLADRLNPLAEADRLDAVLEVVRGEAATVLGHATARAIGAENAFKDLGFDSLAAVELRNRLAGATGVRLPATLIFDHPTPAALAAQLLEELGCTAAGAAGGTGADGDGVPAELARLGEMLAALPGDGAARARVAARLQELAVALGAAAAPVLTDDLSGLDLDVATDEEIFQLMDGELGLS